MFKFVLQKLMGALPWQNMKNNIVVLFLVYYVLAKLTIFYYFRNNWRFLTFREIAECIGFYVLFILIKKLFKLK